MLAFASTDSFFCSSSVVFFFFNDTATTEIYTLSLHDALPISRTARRRRREALRSDRRRHRSRVRAHGALREIGEHTSELQSRPHLVCRLLLEKKKKTKKQPITKKKKKKQKQYKTNK